MKAKVQVFDTDASTNAGYVYTTDQRLSSRLATKNLEDLILKSVSFEGKKVMDIGCGDGHFTRKFWERGNPLSMVGVDPAPSAVAVAASKNDDVPQINFVVGDGYQLPMAGQQF